MKAVHAFISAGWLGVILGTLYGVVIIVLQEQYIAQGLDVLALDLVVEALVVCGVSAGIIGALISIPSLGSASEAGERPRAGIWLARGIASLLCLPLIAWRVESQLNWAKYVSEHSLPHLAMLALGICAGALLIGSLIAVAAARRPSRPVAILFLVPLLGAPAVLALGPTPSGPNLLFISVDTLRADRLSPYGYAEARTPHIQSLADRGAVWENVVASAPVTLVAMTTLMTGQDPDQHGIHFNGYYRLRRSTVTLAELLANRGYRTGAVVGNFVLDHAFRIDQGFQAYDDAMSQLMSDPARNTTPRRRETGAWWKDVRRTQPAQRHADEITDAGLRWLRRYGDEPFFLWLHYMDPHKPYAPPEQFSQGDPYDGEVAFVDSEIGRFLGEFESYMGERRTLIVLVSDHGESLGEHDYTGHVRELYRETLHVPLIMVLPERIEPGTRVTAPVRGRDLRGEILALMEPPDGAHKSRVSAANAEEAESWLAYAETYFYRFELREAPMRTLQGLQWKYIAQENGREELYDLLDDPEETRNVLDLYPVETERMRRAMRERIGREVDDSPESLDDATRERLEALGYIN